jgi:glycosyltransferase involved in cell wall biosynthesis
MNKHMSDDCIFDYAVIGDRCLHESEIHARGGRIYYLTPYRKNPAAYLKDCWDLLKAHKKDGNIAYFQLYSMCEALSIGLSKLAGYAVVLHAHNNNIENKGALYRAVHNINRRLIRRGNCVRLTNSALSVPFMFGHHVEAQVINNAIDTGEFRFNKDIRRAIRQKLRVEDRMVIGFAGRITDQKNPLFLIDIFREIVRIQPKAVLLIAGDGHLRPDVESAVERYGLNDSVRMLGACERMTPFYQAIDLFLLPSRFEGFGTVLIEAQASGLPCVTSAQVVPDSVNVTGLVRYLPLEEGAQYWAQRCVDWAIQLGDRVGYDEKVAAGGFDIHDEAPRLEQILLQSGKALRLRNACDAPGR